ncbi:MAG: hypothetical protein JWN52_2748 [Actinomycetia bacterium]|nr:hypothetical protein [Actinomycetes bacterium]
MTVVEADRSDAPDMPEDRPGRAGPLTRLRAAVAWVWPALVVYAAVRALGLLVLLVWAEARGRSFSWALSRFDGSWYLGIAEHGYDLGARIQSNMAFFPLYPRLVAALEPLSPLDYRGTAIAIAWLASLAAAWGIFAVGAHVADRRTGILLVAVWGAVPHAVVESMAYSEGIFTAFVAWTLYAVLTKRWLTAGLLCVFAGLSRTTATSLIPVVMLVAALAIIRRRGGWRAWAALGAAPLGWLGYILWVGAQMGRIDGWFYIQNEGWKSSFDGGIGTFRAVERVLTRESPLEFVLVTVTLLAAIALFVLCLLDRQPWQLLLYSGLLLATTLGASTYYNSRARYLLPAFTLLMPIARGLAKTAVPRAVVIMSTLAVASAYFGGYLLLIWRYSP